jgi:NADPH:quinone reductase-like Zn-dependent oxidoreductase
MAEPNSARYKGWVVEKPRGDFKEYNFARRSPGLREVLVRVAASGVNPLDTKIRAGIAAHARHPLPAVLGLDMAGTVEEVGTGVSEFKPGDEVYGTVGGVGGLQGTLAQFVTADPDLLARKAKKLTMREAAALPLSVVTAWEGLVDRAKVQPGDRVLVHAGAGGIGHIAVQLAVAMGAEVFTTVSPEKQDIAQRFGAVPIDYRTEPLDDYVARHTAGKGFDIIYDTVGGATLDASFAAVKLHTGRVVSALGWGTHSLAPLSFRGASYSGVFTLLPLLTGEGRAHHGEILSRAGELADEGKLTPLLNKTQFSSSEISAAHAEVERGSLGKTVIEFS